MSYEGREVFICDGGHLHVQDANCIDYGITSAPTECEFCGAKIHYVGSVDDTNGEAAASFAVLEIEPGETQIEYKDGWKIIRIYPARYEVENLLGWINFDTGKLLD